MVRGGYGIFAALTQGSTYYAMRVENGVYQTNYNFNSPAATTALPRRSPVSQRALYAAGSASSRAFQRSSYPGCYREREFGHYHELPRPGPEFCSATSHMRRNSQWNNSSSASLTLSSGTWSTRPRLPVFIDSNLARATQHPHLQHLQRLRCPDQHASPLSFYTASDHYRQCLHQHRIQCRQFLV